MLLMTKKPVNPLLKHDPPYVPCINHIVELKSPMARDYYL